MNRWHRKRPPRHRRREAQPNSLAKTLILGLGIGVVLGLIGIFLLPAIIKSATATTASNAAIREDIMRQSLAAYPGPCPCPYSVLRSGHRCDYNAYEEPGGYEPICYVSDVNWLMLIRYRLAHHSD